ncbi:hypothetical protein MPER_02803, partial [Moniliophthora perniciosa FA553]
IVRRRFEAGFLVYFESELLKRAHKNFTFLNGSIGNYFLAAAQGGANILPVIVTNHTVTIAAELENGEKLVGQNVMFEHDSKHQFERLSSRIS